MTHRCQRGRQIPHMSRTHITTCVIVKLLLHVHNEHSPHTHEKHALGNTHPPYSESTSGRLRPSHAGRHGERGQAGDEGTDDSVGSGHAGEHSRSEPLQTEEERRTRKQWLQRLQGTRHLMRLKEDSLSLEHMRALTNTPSQTTPPLYIRPRPHERPD